MVTGAAQMDGAILVSRQLMDQCHKHVSTSFRSPSWYSNGCIHEQSGYGWWWGFRVVEMEIRDLLSFYEYDGDNVQLFKVLL
jgi:translation elongation factor EF-Tu-like GTPase